MTRSGTVAHILNRSWSQRFAPEALKMLHANYLDNEAIDAGAHNSALYSDEQLVLRVTAEDRTRGGQRASIVIRDRLPTPERERPSKS